VKTRVPVKTPVCTKSRDPTRLGLLPSPLQLHFLTPHPTARLQLL